MLHRHFIVTVWDSKTGESADAEVELPLSFFVDPGYLAQSIHAAVVAAEGGDDLWTFKGGYAGPGGGEQVNLATIWMAPDGTISTESVREVTLTRVQAECKNLVPN